MTISISSSEIKQIVDITDKLERLIKDEDIEEGVCFLFTKHTTCFLTALVSDTGTDQDLLDFISSLDPKLAYRHGHDPSHTPDHLISSLAGPSLVVPITEGKIDLGTWQKIVLVELNGPKERKVSVHFND